MAVQNILDLTRNTLSTDLTSYNFLLYSIPGMGKTTFATQMFPEKSCILGFEFGYKGIPGALGVPIPDYFSFLEYVEQFDTDEARAVYDTLIVDTTTKAGEVIENYILGKFGKDALGDCKAHGGAYPLINRYYNLPFNRLKARGYNFVYICHSKVEDIKNDKGEVINQRYLPKMSDRIKSLIEPEVDYTFFITLDKDGKRILVTDNNSKSLGKQRTPLPLIMPLNIDNFLVEFEKGVLEKSNGNITSERSKTTVVEFKEDSVDYRELVKEIKELGQRIISTDKEKGKEAVVYINNILGKDDNNVQRTLDICTQENEEMLKVILEGLKKYM